MAKSAKPPKSKQESRRDVVERMRRDQKKSESRRTYAVIAAAVVVGLVIVGLGAYPLIQQSRVQAGDLETLGVEAAAANCTEDAFEDAGGNADHRPVGTDIVYEDAPPAFGPHYPETAGFSRKFYSVDDRPDLEYLVHNLEHGYNLFWYDETIAEDDDLLAEVRAIASKFEGDELTDKFIALPWTEADGKAFPDGAHVALTHWRASSGEAEGETPGQEGVWRYCDAPSGEVVADFVETYPYTDSPEPNAP